MALFIKHASSWNTSTLLYFSLTKAIQKNTHQRLFMLVNILLKKVMHWVIYYVTKQSLTFSVKQPIVFVREL